MFQPTRPARGVTILFGSKIMYRLFQPTRPARGVTSYVLRDSTKVDVSTHTPRAGRDKSDCDDVIEKVKVSTHTPRAGRDRLRQS